MRRHIMNAILATSAAALTAPAYAQTPVGPPDWRYWHDGWSWGHMFFGSLMMLLFWGGLILLIVLAVRYFGHASGGGERPAVGKAPLEILEERFARGEIDKEEFDQRKRALSK